MNSVIRASEVFPFPYNKINPFVYRDRYAFILGSRASLKSSVAGGMTTALNLEIDRTTSVMYILKQKNKHASSTYKAIQNAMRKLGTYHTWNMSGSEKITPYI